MMGIKRDVVMDLLPLYLAGEASEATRELVDAYLKEHPEFASAIEASKALDLEYEPVLREDDEMMALSNTRFYLRLRGTLFGMSIFMSCLPCSFVWASESNKVQWLWADYPGLALAMVVLAAVLWAGYWLVCRRLDLSGL